MANELHLYGKGSVTVGGSGLTDYESYGMPVLYLWGDIGSVTKDDAQTFTYKYGDNTGTSTLKWQGATSVGFPKKNFTWNKISTPFEAKEGWGVQKKYCLKANYIDPSHARNIMCARLWGEIVAKRDIVPTELANCPNYGAIDGFPIILVINDEFQGLYTLNIPKDTWTYAMTDGYLIQSEAGAPNVWSDTSTLVMDETDFTIEENPSEDDVETVKTSFKRMMDAVNACDGTDWTTVEQYIDIPSVIDYMCFSAMIGHLDGLKKNVLYVTFDKTKYYITAYDMDSVMGNYWNGQRLVPINTIPTFVEDGWFIPLFNKVMKYRKAEIVERYKTLKYWVMGAEHMTEKFSRFCHSIPLAVRNADSAKWGEMYGTSLDGYMQITDFYRRRLEYLDTQLGIE